MTGKKRVRFKVPDGNRSLSCSPDPASVPNDAAHASADGPKTSEYAFFKKLKQDFTKMFLPYPLSKENRQLHDCRSTAPEGEMVSMVDKNFQSLSNAKKDAPNDPGSLLSLQFSTSMSPDMAIEDKGCVSSESASLLNKHQSFDCLDSSVMSHSSTEINAVSGSKYRGGEVFTMKRQKLQKWIKQTLFPESTELLRGCDLVSELLLRLLPQRTEYKDSLYPWRFGTGNKLHLLTYPGSNTSQEVNCGFPRKLEKTEEDHMLNNGVFFSCSRRSRELSNPDLIDETVDSCRVGYNDRMLIKYEKREPQCVNDHATFWTKSLKHQTFPGRFFESDDTFAACQASGTVPEYESAEHLFLNDAMYSYRPQKSDDMALLMSNSFGVSHTSTAARSSSKLLEPKKSMEDCHTDTTLRLSTWYNFDYNISHRKSSSCASYAMEEMDDPTELKSFVISSEPYSLFLSHDVKMEKNDRIFACPTATKMDASPLPLTLWGRHSLHGPESASPNGGLSISSLVANMYEDQYLDRGDDERMNFIIEGSDHGLLALSHASKQRYLSEG